MRVSKADVLDITQVETGKNRECALVIELQLMTDDPQVGSRWTYRRCQRRKGNGFAEMSSQQPIVRAGKPARAGRGNDRIIPCGGGHARLLQTGGKCVSWCALCLHAHQRRKAERELRYNF